MSKTTTQAVTSEQPDGPRLAMIEIAKRQPRDGLNLRRTRDDEQAQAPARLGRLAAASGSR